MIGATKGGFGYHGIEAAVVQIVVMVLVGESSVLTTKVIRENTRKRFTDTLSRSISELQNANKEIIDSIQTISAISQQVSAHAGETMQAEEENLNVMQDVSAIMQKLVTLAAQS